MEVKGKRKLGLQPVPMHDIALHLHKAEERGEDLPVAITLGNDPIITLMGATPLKYDQSEYEMAGRCAKVLTPSPRHSPVLMCHGARK
jgi:UbiD family decarboxylase